jgi:glycine/D-amino acid oxidase-like deaminating enzyme
MERNEHPRVVVIGAGIVGSAVAMHLAERGLRPVVGDPTRRGRPRRLLPAGGPGPQVHLRQRPDGSVVLGERSQELVAHDLSPRHGQALLGQAARFLPVLHGTRIARTLLAWRSMPADRLPIVGPVPGEKGSFGRGHGRRSGRCLIQADPPTSDHQRRTHDCLPTLRQRRRVPQ